MAPKRAVWEKSEKKDQPLVAPKRAACEMAPKGAVRKKRERKAQSW